MDRIKGRERQKEGNGKQEAGRDCTLKHRSADSDDDTAVVDVLQRGGRDCA